MEPSNVTVKEVKILETAEDIQERREQVLKRYVEFKESARIKREKLEDSRRFQYFRRDADELESWIMEKLQVASDESFRDSTNLQAKIQKHQAFEAEVAANSNAIVQLENKGLEMINQDHFQKVAIQDRLDELHRLWALLLTKLSEKGLRLQQALTLVQFLRQCDEVLFLDQRQRSFCHCRRVRVGFRTRRGTSTQIRRISKGHDQSRIPHFRSLGNSGKDPQPTPSGIGHCGNQAERSFGGMGPLENVGQ